jgi:hypothetical protein
MIEMFFHICGIIAFLLAGALLLVLIAAARRPQVPTPPPQITIVVQRDGEDRDDADWWKGDR